MVVDEHRLQRLIDVGRVLVSELDLEVVLKRVLEVARELTGARYAALGILDERRKALERFLTLGIDDETRAVIGDLPRGRGVLGILISDPKPLRLDKVGEHPRSYGFPPGHPPMGSFLGVPILIRGEAYGNLYLTEKEGGEFSEADEQSAVILADWAAIAIDNARLYTARLSPPRGAGACRPRPRSHDRDRPGARRRNRTRSRPGADHEEGPRACRRPLAADLARGRWRAPDRGYRRRGAGRGSR